MIWRLKWKTEHFSCHTLPAFFTPGSHIILLSWYLSLCVHLSFHLLPSLLFCWLGQTTVPPLCPPVSCCWLRIWLFLSPRRGFQEEVTARLMDSRDHKQVAGGPASEQPTQRCQSAGQTPAASPSVGRRGSTLGSGPVRPALHLTRLSSHRHSPDGLTSSKADSETSIGSAATHSGWVYFSAECPSCVLGSGFIRHLHGCEPVSQSGRIKTLMLSQQSSLINLIWGVEGFRYKCSF